MSGVAFNKGRLAELGNTPKAKCIRMLVSSHAVLHAKKHGKCPENFVEVQKKIALVTSEKLEKMGKRASKNTFGLSDCAC